MLLIIAGNLLLISSIFSQENDPKCVCVPSFQCDPITRKIITDGNGIIGWRSNDVCPEDQVCCGPPEDEEGNLGNSDSNGNEVPKEEVTEVPKEVVTELPKEITDQVPKESPDSNNGVEEASQSTSSVFVCGTRTESQLSFKVSGDIEDTYVSEWDFPWMLGLKYELPASQGSQQSFFCGASLILPSVAVTAAHCAHRKIKENIIVVAGEYDLASSSSERLSPQERRVKEVVLHPKYDLSPIRDDIAILVLDAPFGKNDAVNTICVPAKDERKWSENCYATGWGATAYGGSPNRILRKAKLPLVPFDLCENQLRQAGLGRNFRLFKSFLCAGGNDETDTCQGDGGGPFACQQNIPPYNFYLVGITSWGVGCARKGVPGVYTDVAYASDWIDSTVQQLMDSGVIPMS